MHSSLLTKYFRIFLPCFFLLSLTNIPADAESDWQQLYPSYPTHGYNDIYVVGSSAAFAVGDAGLISFFNGTSWTVMSSPVSDKLNAIWGRSASDVFAVGDNGTIIHYNGSSWQRMSSPTSNNLHSVWGFANPSDPVYAGGRNGNILKYAGGVWSYMETGLADGIWNSTIIYGVWGYSPGNLFAVGYKSGDSNEDIFLRCTDGTNWGEITNFPGVEFFPTAIWGVSGGLMYIAGSDGIYSLTSGGSTWVQVLADSNGISDIWGTDGSDIWAVGDRIYHFNGSSWSTVISNVDPANQWGELNSVSGSSTSNVLAVGSSGRILRYQGSAWSSMTTIPEYTIYDLWHDSDTSLCAVGENGLIIHSNGTSWTPMASATNKSLAAVCGWGNGHFLAAGVGGTVQYYNGSFWTLLTSNTTEDLNDVWCLAPDSAYVVGSNGKILLCDGAGCSVQGTDGTTSNLHAVYSSALGSYAAGVGGVLMKNNGASWNQVTPTSPFFASITDLWGDSAFGGLVAISDNLIYSYNISTNTWSQEYADPDTGLHLMKVTGSSFPNLLVAGFSGISPYDGVVLQRNGGTFSEIKTFSEYHPYTIQEGSLGKLFVGGAQQDQNSRWHGQILQSDGSSVSSTWTNMIETNNLQDIWGGDLDNVFVVGDNGTILHYDGTSVSAMESNTLQDLSAVYAAANTNWACATGGAGGMFYFDGTTWQAGTNSSTEWMNDMWGDGETVFAVGTGGTILKSLNRGADWISETSHSTEILNAVWGVSADGPIFVAGNNGTVLGWSTGGQWSALSSGAYTLIDLYGIWGLSGSDVYVAGYEYPLLGSNQTQIVHYNGSSWEQSFYSDLVLPAQYLTAVWARSAQDVMAFGSPNLRKECSSTWKTWSDAGIPPLRKVWGKADPQGNYHLFGISYYNSIYEYTIPADQGCSSSSPWTLFMPAILAPKK
ncbi:MAG: hypothetical protein PHZ02_08190 [Desulfocapsaceae bacterium]|nr:hypothetical protein [Desulfocapsaceae bacterium]